VDSDKVVGTRNQRSAGVKGENCGSTAVVAIRTIDGSVEAQGN